MTHALPYAAMADTLKAVLRRQKMTYAELGDRLGMSESGVKKMLTAEDASIGRLSEICDVLGMSLLDLVEMTSGERPVYEVTMPADVQAYLESDTECFYVYCSLAYERAEPEEVMARLALTPAAFWRHVRQLDRLRMLTLGPANRILISRIGQHVWVGRGPLVDRFRRQWSLETVEDAGARYGEPGWHLAARTYRLSRASAQALEQDLKRLLAEYETRSVREGLVLADADLTMVRFVSALGPGSFLKPQGAAIPRRP